jgi:hypothetical protein
VRPGSIQGLYRRRRRGCTVRDLHAEPYADLVDRDFVVDGPDELWLTDITEHSTLANGEPKLIVGRRSSVRSSNAPIMIAVTLSSSRIQPIDHRSKHDVELTNQHGYRAGGQAG